jgi:hypothetical protein
VLQAIRANLGQEELQQLLQETEAVLDDDAQVRHCLTSNAALSGSQRDNCCQLFVVVMGLKLFSIAVTFE